MRFPLNFAFWLALVLVALAVGVGQTSASTSSGFTVSPAFSQVHIRTDQPEVTYTLSVTNRASVDQTFLLSVVDFGALDESGGVAFLGAPAGELEHKYGLASWMVLEKNTVFVAAGKTAQVVVTISNRQSLAPGGHYGAVLATAVNDPGTQTGDRVGVKQVLSSLVLVTKDGGAKADLRLDSQVAAGGIWGLPRAVSQRFQNAGNVHLVPRGVIELKDPAGRVVKRAAINDGSQVILPESFRKYKTTLVDVRTAIWPGEYKLVSTYRYDGISTTASFTTTVWYAGQIIVWGGGLLALLVSLGLGLWIWKSGPKSKRQK